MSDAVVAWATAAGVVVAATLGIIGIVQARGAKRDAQSANEIQTEANKLVADANRVIKEQAARDMERSDVAWDWRWDDVNAQFLVVQNIGKNKAMQAVAQFFFDGKSVANHKLPLDMEGQEEMRLEMPGLAEARYSAWEQAEIARYSVEPHNPRLHSVRVRVAWNTPLGSPGLLDTGVMLIPVLGLPRPDDVPDWQ